HPRRPRESGRGDVPRRVTRMFPAPSRLLRRGHQARRDVERRGRHSEGRIRPMLRNLVTRAADQTILGHRLVVKIPSTPDEREIVSKAKEDWSPDTILGNP